MPFLLSVISLADFINTVVSYPPNSHGVMSSFFFIVVLINNSLSYCIGERGKTELSLLASPGPPVCSSECLDGIISGNPLVLGEPYIKKKRGGELWQDQA